MNVFIHALIISLLVIPSLAIAAPSKNVIETQQFLDVQHVGFLKKLFGGDTQQSQASTSEVDKEAQKQRFLEQSYAHKNQRFRISPITYEMRIPEEWENLGENLAKNPKLDQRLLQKLEVFRGPLIVGGDRPIISLEAILMEYEVLIEHWLRDYIFRNGFTLENDIVISSLTQASAGIIFVKNGLPYRSYIRAMLVENRIFVVRFDTPTNVPLEILNAGFQSVDSFKIENARLGTAEGSNEFSLTSDLRFSYPESWIIKNHSLSSAHQIAAELHNIAQNGAIKGLVRLQAHRVHEDQSFNSVIKGVRDSIRNERKIKVTELTHSIPLDIGINFDLGYLEKYKVSTRKDQEASYELWLTVLSTEKWINVMYLITPSEELDFSNWARNTRMFDLLLRSLD